MAGHSMARRADPAPGQAPGWGRPARSRGRIERALQRAWREKAASDGRAAQVIEGHESAHYV